MSKIGPIRMPCGRCAPSAPCSPREVRYPFALSVQIRHFRVVTPFRSRRPLPRSEEHTSELQSLMRISYAVFCLKKKHTTISYQNILNIITPLTSLHYTIH